MTSFLQSDAWMDFQKSLGREVFRVGENLIIKHELLFGTSYLYLPYAPSRPMTNEELRITKELARQEHAIFVKAEPMQDDIAQQLISQGFQKSNKKIQPHRTVVIDLTKNEDELLSAMHHKTRYNIRVAERQGIVVRQCRMTNDELRKGIDIFWRLMQKTSARDKFSSYPKQYYEKLMKFAELWIAYHHETPVAAALVAVYGDQSYYLHGASDHEYRAMMAPYMLHWSIIRNLKLEIGNLRIYDLWGIDSARWPGVTRFKLGWGGRTIEYPGAFDLVISRPWYLAYSLAQGLK